MLEASAFQALQAQAPYRGIIKPPVELVVHDLFRHQVSVVKQPVKRPGVRRSEIQKIFACIENALAILVILCADREPDRPEG